MVINPFMPGDLLDMGHMDHMHKYINANNIEIKHKLGKIFRELFVNFCAIFHYQIFLDN